MHLVMLVNTVNCVVVLVHCTLTVCMLVDAVIEVMLVNASCVAVYNYFTHLLYSGSSIGEYCIAVLLYCTLVVNMLVDAIL